jgi:hypothetical protein
VRHAFDQNQRLNFLAFTPDAGKIIVTAPATANLCPPGHYMLFVLSKDKIPSVARIIRITLPVQPPSGARAATATRSRLRLAVVNCSPSQIAADMRSTASRPAVLVGIAPTCPYGPSACWAGAYDARRALDGVKAVSSIANTSDSTADVYLTDDRLPDANQWAMQFAARANGSYSFRGIEMTLHGSVRSDDGRLTLEGAGGRAPVVLAPLQANDKIQWDHVTGAPQPLTQQEYDAYQELSVKIQSTTEPLDVAVTGPLLKNENGFYLKARHFA